MASRHAASPLVDSERIVSINNLDRTETLENDLVAETLGVDHSGHTDHGSDGRPRRNSGKYLGNPRHGRRFFDDATELRSRLSRRPSEPIGIDLETKGLHPHSSPEAAVGAIIASVAGQKYILREFPEWWPELLADADRPKIMHNAKFDLMWMIEFCPSPDGQILARNIQDTMLKSQLVSEYRTKSGAQKAGRADLWRGNDLKTVLEDRLGVTISKSIYHEDTTEVDEETGEEVFHRGVDWTGEWSDEMIEYMLEDISYLVPLNDKLDKEIRKQGQERASWIENNAVFATAWMTLNGIKPDVVGWSAAITDWQEQHHETWIRLQEQWPGVDNFNSPKQLVESSAQVLGGRLLNTKKATLKQLAGSFPPVATLLEQRHLATRLKNWGPHFLEAYVCGQCSRFHPGWNQIGTETSRPSCWKPNLLQFPRAPEFRGNVVAEPGYVIASLDYSAIEVLVAAVFAQEPRLIEACATGDPHLATARMIANDDTIVKSDPRRQYAKIANFGLLFAGGADGLVTQARDLFDVMMTKGEAMGVMERYFRLYPGLKRTKNLAYRAMESDDLRVTVVNAVGFRRYLENYNRKATSWLNTWIQSTAAYGMKSTFRYFNEAMLTPFILGQVYDEVLFEFPEDCASELAQQAKLCMIRGMQDVLGQNIPVTVDVNIGRCWL